MKNITVKITFLVSLLLMLQTASAQWSALEEGVGADGGFITSLAVYNNQLYAGGSFDSASYVAANNLAFFTGTAWQAPPVGVNPPPLDGPAVIFALAVYNSSLYLTGFFDSAGNLPTGNIAAWNGTGWDTMSTNIYQGSAMAVYNNDLYVAGGLIDTNGVAITGLARFDGSTWTTVAGGLRGGTGPTALTVYNNKLIVGGNFDTAGAGNLPVNNIAAWDGNNWSALGPGVGDSSSGIQALAVVNGNLYAGGFIDKVNSTPTRNMAEWNGNSWQALGGGLGADTNSEYVACLIDYNGTLVAGGMFSEMNGNQPANSIAAWNGNTWSSLSTGVTDTSLAGPGFALAMCIWNGDLIVGGGFTNAGTISTSDIAKWSGPAGITETESTRISVYPNPACNTLIIENITPGTPLTIENLLGQPVIQRRATGNRQTIDVSGLSGGMYFINGVKFVKE